MTSALGVVMRTSLASVVALGLISTASFARAEAGVAPPRCAVRFVPSPEQRVPANAPALVAVQPGGLVVTKVAARIVSPTFDGGFDTDDDPREPAAFLLRPSSVFATNTSYSIQVDPSCSRSDPYESSRPQHSFVTSEPSALPTSIGTVSASLSRDGYTPTSTIVEVQATPELAAYAALAFVDLHVDGKRWARIPYGKLDRSPGTNLLRASISASYVEGNLAERSLCDEGETDVKTKTIELRVHVAGATEDPPAVEATVPFDCRRPTYVGNKTGSAPENDAGADDPGALPGSSTAPLVGCACDAAGRADETSGWSAFGAGLVIAFAALRGRRVTTWRRR